MHLVFAFFAAAAWLPGAGFEAAWASAWLLPPGDGQIITYSAFSDSTRAFDGHGNLIPVPDYQKFELGTYVEYGVTDWLTVSAAPAYDRVQTPVPGQSYTGVGESEVAARVGLYHTDSAVLSVQAGLRSPGASFDSLGPLDVRRAAFHRRARPRRAQLRRRGNRGVCRGPGRIPLLCWKSAGGMAL